MILAAQIWDFSTLTLSLKMRKGSLPHGTSYPMEYDDWHGQYHKGTPQNGDQSVLSLTNRSSASLWCEVIMVTLFYDAPLMEWSGCFCLSWHHYHHCAYCCVSRNEWTTLCIRKPWNSSWRGKAISVFVKSCISSWKSKWLCEFLVRLLCRCNACIILGVIMDHFHKSEWSEIIFLIICGSEICLKEKKFILEATYLY